MLATSVRHRAIGNFFFFLLLIYFIITYCSLTFCAPPKRAPIAFCQLVAVSLTFSVIGAPPAKESVKVLPVWFVRSTCVR